MSNLVEALTIIGRRKTDAQALVDEAERMWDKESAPCKFKLPNESLDCTYGSDADPFCSAGNCPLIDLGALKPWDKTCPYCASEGCTHEDWVHSSAYKEGTTLCYDPECPLTQ